MASRRKKTTFNPLEGKAAETATLENVTDGIFGSGASGVPQREVIKLIPINLIQPDPAQPRRVLPSAIRGLGISNMDELFAAWMQAANQEKATRQYPDLEWKSLLDPSLADFEEENFTAKDHGPIAAALIKVALLARSIKQDGLINPITVARSGREHLIETGERRWWAYNLLAQFDEQYKKIPAREVERRDIWRQAVENLSREELSAIGRARQFAILMMDLYTQEGVEFQSYAELVKEGCDRDYYAQVADGSKFQIPRGKADRLCGAMGINNPKTLREIRAMLRVDDDIWNEADDYGHSWAWILDMDRLRRQRNQDDKIRPVPKTIPEGVAVLYSTPTHQRDSEEADLSARLAPFSIGQEFEVLTMGGFRLIVGREHYKPTSPVIGKYREPNRPLNRWLIAQQQDFLIFCLEPNDKNGLWIALTPFHAGQENLKDAVRCYRDGDLGENRPLDGRKIQVLTLVDEAEMIVPDRWQPTDARSGLYPTASKQTLGDTRLTRIEIGLYYAGLIYRHVNADFPRMNSGWQPVLPSQINLATNFYVKEAVDRFRAGDYGWAVEKVAELAEFEAMTIDGIQKMVAPESYAPESDMIGIYPTSPNQSLVDSFFRNIEISYQNYWLIWRFQSTRHPGASSGWGAILPDQVRRDHWLEDALKKYRNGDLGWGKPKPATPAGKVEQPPASAVDKTADKKDGVFVSGSGFVPNVAPASASAAPAQDEQPEPKYQIGQRVILKGGMESKILLSFWGIDIQERRYKLTDKTVVRESLIEGLVDPAPEDEAASIVTLSPEMEQEFRRDTEEWLMLNGVPYELLDQWDLFGGKIFHRETGQYWDKNVAQDWRLVWGHLKVHAYRTGHQIDELLSLQDEQVDLLAKGSPTDLSILQVELEEMRYLLDKAQKFARKLSDAIDDLRGKDLNDAMSEESSQ